jgi:ATP/maltotriose-dependent transcriptional regulator MalT
MLDKRYGDARSYFARVLAQYGSNDAHGMTTATRLLLAKIELASGTVKQAISLAKEALATIRARGYPVSARFAGASAIAVISQPEFTKHYDDDERETLTAVQRWLPAAQSNASDDHDTTLRVDSRASALAKRRNDDANNTEDVDTAKAATIAHLSDRPNPSDGTYASAHATRLAHDAAESISPREMEVLELIAAGESNKIIARRLDLSPHTVKRHVANILGKLAVESRGQAAARYRELVG